MYSPLSEKIVLVQESSINFLRVRFVRVIDIKIEAIDTPGGKRNLKMKIKAQQMTFRQDITKI
jgi:hypothetical protein